MEKHKIEKYAEEQLKKIYNNLGKPIFPSYEEAQKYWTDKCYKIPPRSVAYVYDFKAGNTPLWYNLELLGYKDEEVQSFEEHIVLAHPNQKKLILYLASSLFDILSDFGQHLLNNDCYYTLLRSISDRNGKMWLALQLSQIFQLDENLNLYSNYSQIQLISEYQGEPLSVDVFEINKSNKESENIQKIRKRIISRLRYHLLESLGFTSAEENVLHFMKDKLAFKNKDLASGLKKSEKTLENQVTSIITKARELFPLNEFRNVRDIVSYMNKQNLI